MKRKLIAAIGVAGMLVGVAACGSDKDSGGSTAGGSKNLTVWVMDGSAPEPWIKAVNKEFEAKHKGVKVDVKIQKWDGIQEKITTALSEDTPPDVIELGNTQTAGYAATGGLADLTEDKAKLGADGWNKGMLPSAELEGKTYAAPWWAANRVVVYDKKAFKDAGVTPPKTRDEWIAGLEKIKSTSKGKTQPIYLPGQSWYVLAGFIWDEGGDLAVKDGDKWKGTLSDAKSIEGMNFYKKLQSFSTAPKDKDEATPQQSTDVIPKGGVASWIGLGWEAGGAVDAIKKAGAKSDFGYFPIPGKTADKPGSVFFGGSNLAVAERSQNKDLAKEWLTLASGKDQMAKYAEATGGAALPNHDSAAFKAPAGTFAEAMGQAASVGKLTPITEGWANVETNPNPIKEYMTKVLKGEDAKSAATAADKNITERINKK